MLELLLEPFALDFMFKAIWVSALVGGVCAFLSCYLILKGWSLMGDAMSHAVVPGVAGAYILNFPYAIGAFFTAMLAASSIALVRHFTRLREDAIIGFIFSGFFAMGLLLVSIFPTSISVQRIILGNILTISDNDVTQILIIVGITVLVMCLIWKDLLLVFFDEQHARSIGLPVLRLKVVFFIMLSACIVAALQTVGVIMVISMVITPGATAYLLTDRFPCMLLIALVVGTLSSAVGAWSNYFINASTGGVIVCLQTIVFLLVFVFAPKYGWLARVINKKNAMSKIKENSHNNYEYIA